ncbi:hypothetical protein ACTWP5_09720 [Streptomyces sp. 4N509B]|uniref:hypothetical protein n=1 Tax=Streptomyces sp. 4N509B TaxID=3457413 RepID=UPI003FD179AF
MADVSTAGPDLAARTAAFVSELQVVTAGLDPSVGWYAAFARRHPEELHAWLDGRTLPPWDVLADLLQDYAVLHGLGAAERTGWRVRERYEAVTRARDALPGGPEALRRGLSAAEAVAREAQQRERLLAAAEGNADRAGQGQEATRLAALRLWAQDDRERAMARQAELRARLAACGAVARRGATPPAPAPTPQAAPTPHIAPAPQEASAPPRPVAGEGPPQAVPTAPTAPGGGRADGEATGTPVADTTQKQRSKPRRTPRGARFAGLEDEAAPVPATAPPAATPLPEAAPPPGGSRFAGAVGRARDDDVARVSETDQRAVSDTAASLRALRDRGQGGAAHAVLSEAAGGPAARLPLLVAELERAGMASDLATLLWELASLPPGPLATAARALAVAGRERECGQLLSQGAARPAPEAGSVAVELWSRGRGGEAVTLLSALVRARTAEEAALAATADPAVVVPLLLDAAWRVSPRHHYAVTSELRRAGVA